MNEYQLAFHNYQTDSSILKSYTNHRSGRTTKEDEKALNKLVERATPKKVIPNSCVNVVGNCPICNEIIEEGHEYRFHVDEGKIGSCPNPECRQALDWSE